MPGRRATLERILQTRPCPSLSTRAAGAGRGNTPVVERTGIDRTKEAANPVRYGYADVTYVLYPAAGMDRTLLVAIAGAICSLVLLGTWLRPGEDEW